MGGEASSSCPSEITGTVASPKFLSYILLVPEFFARTNGIYWSWSRGEREIPRGTWMLRHLSCEHGLAVPSARASSNFQVERERWRTVGSDQHDPWLAFVGE